MTYYQLNAYKHPPNTHFANVKYLYHKQTFKNWCSPVIKVMVIKVIKGFGGSKCKYTVCAIELTAMRILDIFIVLHIIIL